MRTLRRTRRKKRRGGVLLKRVKNAAGEIGNRAPAGAQVILHQNQGARAIPAPWVRDDGLGGWVQPATGRVRYPPRREESIMEGREAWRGRQAYRASVNDSKFTRKLRRQNWKKDHPHTWMMRHPGNTTARFGRWIGKKLTRGDRGGRKRRTRRRLTRKGGARKNRKRRRKRSRKRRRRKKGRGPVHSKAVVVRSYQDMMGFPRDNRRRRPAEPSASELRELRRAVRKSRLTDETGGAAILGAAETAADAEEAASYIHVPYHKQSNNLGDGGGGAANNSFVFVDPGFDNMPPPAKPATDEERAIAVLIKEYELAQQGRGREGNALAEVNNSIKQLKKIPVSKGRNAEIKKQKEWRKELKKARTSHQMEYAIFKFNLN
jgi:hypothetical protein